MSAMPVVTAGTPWPLGVTPRGTGVNVAVFSANATRMTLCLFSDDGKRERHRLDLPERTGDIWHGHVSDVAAGQLYGLRADGPWNPHAGHRFNVNKLLLDPYARRLTGHPVWNDALMGHGASDPHADLAFDVRDSAPFMPRCVVTADAPFGQADSTRPGHAWTDTILYEAHVKGLTKTMPGVAAPGSFAGLASDAAIDHLTRLGVTAVELLPVQAFLDDRFVTERGLTNYWGYQTIGFFAPEPRYATQDAIAEFRHMVRRLHGAGIEVILDVVYNHTGEGDELGPTLSFRGLDNASYYRLSEGGRHYINDTGTGNTLNTDHPMVLRMVMDSLRYWVEVMGVDGFRFDLCATLGRTTSGFDPGAGFFDAIRQDPVLAQVKLIAEPWDIGPGGYQLGAFPPPFAEWNDRYRDGVRRFWRGDAGEVPALAASLAGSAALFDHSGRPATSSVNLLTAHDGFTLNDLVSFGQRHNMANGEGNRDGHGENHSDNMGHEGESDAPDLIAARARRRRNLMATLLLSQGTPMILAGDEIGNSQGGNNNAYAQDNPTGWLNWDRPDPDFLDFTRAAIALRKALPVLRQGRFLHGGTAADGCPDLIWRRADGALMDHEDWSDAANRLLCAEMRMAAETPAYAGSDAAAFLVFNAAGTPARVTLPPAPDGARWRRRLDTDTGSFEPVPLAATLTAAPASVVVCVLDRTRPEAGETP